MVSRNRPLKLTLRTRFVQCKGKFQVKKKIKRPIFRPIFRPLSVCSAYTENVAKSEVFDVIKNQTKGQKATTRNRKKTTALKKAMIYGPLFGTYSAKLETSDHFTRNILNVSAEHKPSL